MKFLTLNRCPHGIEMISLDDEGGGTNLTGNKCCGRWHEVKRWPMHELNLRNAANEFETAALTAEGDDECPKK